MKTCVLRGPVLTQSGYGVHGRQIARWLLKNRSSDFDTKIQALGWGMTPWVVSRTLYGEIFASIMERCVPLDLPSDVTFQLQLPNEWDPKMGKFNVGITAGVETDICNVEWVNACNKMNMVIVPSEFVKKTFMNSGAVSTPIRVVPESFIDECSSDTLPDSEFSFNAPFNFLMFGQLTVNSNFQHADRKNTYNTLKWLCESFKNNSDVGIVIRTNMGRHSLIDRMNTANTLKQMLSEVRKGIYPRVTLLHGDFTDSEVASLYRHPKIKALVTATHGEGYGLPILEAAASGLPIIATGWSGHTDFLTSGKYISLQYDLKEVHPSRIDGNIFVKGAKWAYPIEEDFKKKVLKFYSSSSVPKQWAVEMQTKIRNQYSFDAVAEQYDRIFQK